MTRVITHRVSFMPNRLLLPGSVNSLTMAFMDHDSVSVNVLQGAFSCQHRHRTDDSWTAVMSSYMMMAIRVAKRLRSRYRPRMSIVDVP